jgi:hypothetical protein
MNRRLLQLYLTSLSIGLAAVCLVNAPETTMAVCLLDVISLPFLILVHLRMHEANAVSPTLWSLIGYVSAGQLPLLIDLAEGRLESSGFGAATINKTAILIFVGYRVLLVAVLLVRSPRVPFRRVELKSMPLAIPVALAAIGVLARLVISNNVTGQMADWVWYYALAFVCTPAAIALVNPAPARQVKRSPVHGIITILVLLAAGVCALADVSRKDTGMTLLALLLLHVVVVQPQEPFLRMAGRRAVMITIILGVLGGLLMATRAYSWATNNNESFASEFRTSLRDRRANDVIEQLAFVLDTTPATYPYLDGITLGSVLPIPRTVWPDRPAAHSYYVGLQWRGRFATEFDPREMGTNQLSLSAHLLGEGYANFGFTGAIVFEFVFGLLVAWYEHLLADGRLVVLRILYPVILFFILTQQRGDIAMMNTPWLTCAGVLWLVTLGGRLLRTPRTSMARKLFAAA